MSDEPCSLIEPLLPEPTPQLLEGRPRVPARQAWCVILFPLHTGIQWKCLPRKRVRPDVLAAPGRMERGRGRGNSTWCC
ncbi:transposase [Streptomyces massasporeus]|uniref:transposase n=1 Tax=Streptomyces massasporeus TaxID=67324 RepID=UPI0036CC5A8E